MAHDDAQMRVPLTIREVEFCAIDFESAGAARGRTDVPVQIGLARWSLAEGHGPQFVSYLASDQPVTWAARKVHGIGDEDLAGAPRLAELWPQVREALADRMVVAHGMGTEKRFLRAFPGHRFGPWIDSLLLARAAWPQAPSHALSDLCLALGLEGEVRRLVPAARWHDALFDAVASLALLRHLIATFGLADRSPELLLHPDLAAWAKFRGF